MRFSLCIPNYNYARYIGDTIRTILTQEDQDFEIVICDNASSDRSVEVIKGFNDSRIRLHVNACNIGFGGNLERVTRMARGELMFFLPSDDQLRPGALETYRRLYDLLGNKDAVVTSSCDVIDGNGNTYFDLKPDPAYWKPEDRDPRLEKELGCSVYHVPAAEMLKRCLKGMKNPFPTLATCFPRNLHDAVEGYWGGRLFSPDKWFLFRLLAVASSACFIDRRLFGYRWHQTNQEHLQIAAGNLKYLVDGYATTLEMPNEVLERAKFTRTELERSFIENDIVNHGLATLARGNHSRAKRILNFGQATYPQHVRSMRKTRALQSLLMLGPVGQKVAAYFYRRHLRQVDDPLANSMGLLP